jgi:hypothetical protein
MVVVIVSAWFLLPNLKPRHPQQPDTPGLADHGELGKTGATKQIIIGIVYAYHIKLKLNQF